MIRDVAVKVPEPEDFITEAIFPSHIVVPRCSGNKEKWSFKIICLPVRGLRELCWPHLPSKEKAKDCFPWRGSLQRKRVTGNVAVLDTLQLYILPESLFCHISICLAGLSLTKSAARSKKHDISRHDIANTSKRRWRQSAFKWLELKHFCCWVIQLNT